jgi:hypothetical protein
MNRPTIPASVKVDVVINQAGGSIRCPLCYGQLYVGDARILEHLTARQLGGPDVAGNLAYVHKACAATKTNGNKTTSAGGDIHKIAKVKRLAKAQETHAAIVAKTEAKKPGSMKSRPWPKKGAKS